MSLNQIKVDPGDTARTVDQSATVGSRSIERAGPQIRQAAAAARQELLRLAAANWALPADKLTVVTASSASSATPAKKVSYGQLVGGKKFNARITATGTGRDIEGRAGCQSQGPSKTTNRRQTVKRFEIPPKSPAKRSTFNDVRIPGMLQGRVVRPPMISTEPMSIDQDSIKNIPGVVMIVREGKFVGVVAKTEWAAIKAAQALKVTWSKPTTANCRPTGRNCTPI